MLNFDEIAKIITEKWELIAAVMVIVSGTGIAGIAGLIKWQTNRQQQARLRQIPRGDFPFEVIKPGSSDLLKQIMGGDEQNPLADCNIPYQERQRDRNVCQELEAAFAEKNWVLILGKSGLGKTREAAHLADVLNKEGWTVLKLKDQPGEWLDVPKQFPSEISPDDKLLFFLDDVNRWMYAGNPHEIHPQAGEELARPLREAVQERLPRLLQYFEQQGKLGYVRVIATARDEQEPDKPGDLSPWEKLQWEKYKAFWRQFRRYALAEPSEGAIVRLLTDCVAAAGLQGNPAEYGQMARRNDGTFRNITVNLTSAQSRDLAVNDREFSPRLDETWRRRYNKVVQRYPLAKHVYDAVELLRTLNLWLTAPMLGATTRCLLPGRGVRHWLQVWQLRRVLRYLVTTEQILKPKDGQIEAKKTGAVEVGRYIPVILQVLSQMAKRHPTYPVTAECFDCGVALGNLNHHEEAIASYDKAVAFKPDFYEAWHNRGIALHNLNRFEEAIASYDKTVAFKPDDHAAWHRRGAALFHLNRFEEAIASCDQAVAFKPDDHAAWLIRGITLGNLNRFEEEIASYDKTVAFKPDDDYAWYGRGVALHNLNHFEEAIASYDQAVAYKPDDHKAWYNRGIALHNLNRFEEEIASYDQAVSIKPDKHEAWYNRGIALGNLNRFEEEIASYDQALAFKPDDHKAWYNRGIALRNLNRFEEAIASYDQAVSIKPDKHEAWYGRGIALGNLNRFEEAIASYDQAVSIKPDKHEAWYNRGIALGNLNRFEEAIASYDQALAYKPDDHDVWCIRGITLGNLNRFEEAIASYDQALAFKPDDHDVWYMRGAALFGLNRSEEAISSYEQALAFKPDDHGVWYCRGLILGYLNRFEEAIASYDQAVAFKPDDHAAWNSRGIALSDLKRFEEAISSYDQALAFKPDYHEAWYNRGIALRNLNRFEEAISSYDQALVIKPDDPSAFYNKACCYALQGHIELATENLQRAIQLNPDQSRQLATTDPGFDPIRDDSRFQTCLNLASPE